MYKFYKISIWYKTPNRLYLKSRDHLDFICDEQIWSNMFVVLKPVWLFVKT